MLFGIVHGDWDWDAGDVGEAVLGILVVVALEYIMHGNLHADTHKCCQIALMLHVNTVIMAIQLAN